MTMIRGVRILGAPCCGKRYAYPNYVSMNFMAFEHWTDGWRVGSLMPNDSGLRLCLCGNFIRLRDLVEMGKAEESDLPRLQHIPAEQLSECIAQAKGVEMEIAARFAYWRELNHAYRETYRVYRDEEEQQLEASWREEQRQRQSWLRRLVRWPLPNYVRPGHVQITYPPFEPSAEQIKNMTALADKLLAQQQVDPSRHQIWLAELYRELRRFDEAKVQIDAMSGDERGVTSKLITELIEERVASPVRYRM